MALGHRPHYPSATLHNDHHQYVDRASTSNLVVSISWRAQIPVGLLSCAYTPHTSPKVVRQRNGWQRSMEQVSPAGMWDMPGLWDVHAYADEGIQGVRMQRMWQSFHSYMHEAWGVCSESHRWWRQISAQVIQMKISHVRCSYVSLTKQLISKTFSSTGVSDISIKTKKQKKKLGPRFHSVCSFCHSICAHRLCVCVCLSLSLQLQLSCWGLLLVAIMGVFVCVCVYVCLGGLVLSPSS